MKIGKELKAKWKNRAVEKRQQNWWDLLFLSVGKGKFVIIMQNHVFLTWVDLCIYVFRVIYSAAAGIFDGCKQLGKYIK